MTEKVLIKYTTIPQHLYVNRNADEQLKSIVQEMQRPGYVLVARQMGKTNLLFNAKRTLENESRLFVYVDLSNTYVYERDCYRNIIDSIIEPNESLFEHISCDIEELRQKELPSHKEYSKSLRLILKEFQGDIVIILDEVDALRSADYSDNIFAQIRSNYFSRTNFSDFDRLTYILSGVIEPSSLIKDRNKSPFNIGEKIYLDDFTKEEHNTFINKSQLNVSSEVSKKIYAWANGNPRLTFDICSEVESFIIKNSEIRLDDLNAIITEKYLTNFDISPIDHVRELVKSNKEVRVALLSILKGKAEGLSDEIKKKLYLYGIINSKFDETTVIKNQVIKSSLSENWLQSIDKESKSNFTYALSLYERGEYGNAIESFLGFMENSHPTLTEVEASNYYIGYSYYHLKEYQKAFNYFGKEFEDDEFKENSKSFLGICKLGMGEPKEGKEILEGVIKLKGHNFAYHNALLNLARSLDSSEEERALELYHELYHSTFKATNSSSSDLNQLRTLSSYSQAAIFVAKDNFDKAVEQIDLALMYSSSADAVFLKYQRNIISDSKEKGLNQVIVDSIVEENLRLETVKAYPYSFTEEHLYSYLDFVFDPENIKLFEKLLSYAVNQLYSKKISKFELVYLSSKDSDKSEEILNYILSFEKSVSKELLLEVYRDLSFKHSNGSSKYLSYFNKYKGLFNQVETLTKEDIYLFSYTIKQVSDLNRFNKALELCDMIERRISGSEDDEIILESLIIYYWYANLNFKLHNNLDSILYADKTIQLIQESKKDRTSLIDEEGFKSIQEQMDRIKSSTSVGTPVVHMKKYGRNEKVKVRYSDGKIIESKYKKVKADILAEVCEIIS